ncbi:Crp/Fnr family transcriptional regulator [Oceaniglobus ichthyenteri]|uniref:Crp/Fnr family transcriptional regulator n=1 Tax=Oceaniglobus ichthyenteri TaxID=2136177 RepID=UPI000D34ACF7|nr:Crp/Fnr family transcriptional regulator [Oceaniglobus ichthyenteri]
MSKSALLARLPGDRTGDLAQTLQVQCRIPSVHAKQGTLIADEGDFADHSILLLKGWIGLSKTLISGDRQIIDVMLPGDFALIGTEIVPVAACSVEALSDVEYIVVHPMAANGPDAAFIRLRKLMAASILTAQSRTSELLLRLGRGNAANRIAYALLEFYVRLEYVGRTQGTRFEFPITQQKLGEFTGLTNVHVCRTLRRFEREGLISHPDSGTICLEDVATLCALADIDIGLLKEEILMRALPV